MTDITIVWAAIARKLDGILAAHNATWRRTELGPDRHKQVARDGRRTAACGGDRIRYTLAVGDRLLEWVHPDEAWDEIEHDITVLVLMASEAAQSHADFGSSRVVRDLVRLFGHDDARAIVQLSLLAWQLSLVEFDVYRVACAYDEMFSEEPELSEDGDSGGAFAEVGGYLDQLWLTRVDIDQAKALIANTLAALTALPI